MPRKELSFKTHKPEYGTNIVFDARKGKLVSPLRKEEVVKSKFKFSSKTYGLETLQNLINGTGAELLNFKSIKLGEITEKEKYKLEEILSMESEKILVRSDHSNPEDMISQRERLLQPRAVFPNTPEGRFEAINLILDLKKDYGVLIHHRDSKQGKVIGHGRVFVNGRTGSKWIYFAEEDKSTNTFSRWKHKLANKKTKTRKSNYETKIHDNALNACEKVGDNVALYLKKTGFQDIAAASFVVYEKNPLTPEFYDLLKIRGLKRPGFTPF
ncbi:MAG: hypothetical protein JW703_02315 [Candidatus Diapherotrites archaeon]|nr:hypothetical protein [Candidatus Diapherotrites archaeon]